MKNQPEFLELIKSRIYEDPLIKINHTLPKNFMSTIQEKYNISAKEISPQVQHISTNELAEKSKMTIDIE